MVLGRREMGMNLHQGLLARLFWMVVLYFQVQTPFCLVLFISNRNAKCKERKQTLIIHIQMLKWHKCSLPLTLKQTLHHMTPKPVQGPQTGMIMRSLIIIMQSWEGLHLYNIQETVKLERETSNSLFLKQSHSKQEVFFFISWLLYTDSSGNAPFDDFQCASCIVLFCSQHKSEIKK